jgi:transposase-like protein
MRRYSAEQKEALIKRMMPPMNTPVMTLVEETGISDCTLYTWRKQARERGLAVPGNGKNPEQWRSKDKFAIVLETASMNETQLAEYCRRKGLYAEQITAWRQACEGANTSAREQQKHVTEQSREDKKKIKQLERELRQKEKALAETAALLVLRKKANAIWGEGEDA